jgi:hypothetical protein
MLIEFREYTLFPGKRDEWVRYMQDVIVPFQSSLGVVVLGMWCSETDPDVFYWMRRFDNEDARKAVYDAVYKSDRWLNEIAPVVATLLDRPKIKNSRLIPTDRSVMQ